jgi:MFS family permease
VIGAVVFVDTMFYAAIAPLLPALARTFALSKFSAGVMTAAYPAGTLLASLPGGMLAVRAGPKRTVYVGLALLAGSTLAFGLLDSVPALDAARFVEGVGGACSWAGGLAWIVAEASPERRGTMIGAALAAGIGGALFGPVIGTVADGIGRAPAFSAVVVLALLLLVAARGLPLEHEASGQGIRNVLAAFGAAKVNVAMWLVALPAAASGLHRFGAAALAIGGTFLAAAVCEAAVSPVIGRISDSRGRLLPIRFGLAGATVLLACFTLPSSALALALLIVVTAATLGTFWAPAIAMLSDVAEARGLDQGLAAALINLAWAVGQIAGAGGGGAVAKAAGDGVPMTAAAALCAVTLILLIRYRPGR